MVVYIYRMNVKDKFYIGSTKDIHKRKWEHNYDCYHQNRKHYNYKVYKYIRDNCNDWSEVSFQILDVYDDINKKFRKEIEQYYIDYFSNNLNMIDANFSKEKCAIKERKRNEVRKKKVNCECGRVVSGYNIGSHRKSKIHQELMIGIIRTKLSKEDYGKKRNEERRKKVQCECGRIVSFGSIGSHRKSKFHQEFLNK